METFVKLFNEGDIGPDNMIYDKNQFEIFRVSEISIFNKILLSTSKYHDEMTFLCQNTYLEEHETVTNIKNIKKIHIISLVMLCIILSVFLIHRGTISYSAFSGQEDIEKFVNQSISLMNDSYLSENLIKEEVFDYDKYEEFAALLNITNKYYVTTQKGFIELKKLEALFHKENEFSVETYRTNEDFINTRTKLDKYNRAVDDYIESYIHLFENYKKKSMEIQVNNKSQQELLDSVRTEVINNSTKVIDYCKNTRKSTNKLQELLQFMQLNMDKYIITDTGVRFLNEYYKDNYLKLLNAYYNK
jgi:hypothetical protein